MLSINNRNHDIGNAFRVQFYFIDKLNKSLKHLKKSIRLDMFHGGIQGLPKGTDTFQSLMNKKLDNLRKFFHITKVSIKCHFLKNFGKNVKLSFNGLTCVNSLCSI